MNKTYNRAPAAPKKGPLSYILPFLIIIALGFLAVLLYNFFLYQGPSSLRENSSAKAHLLIEEGDVKVKPWGEDRYTAARNGDTLYSGDTIATTDEALVNLKFFDKSIVRLDKNTELVFNQLTSEKDSKIISLTLKKGNVWVSVSDDPADLMIETPNTLVSVTSTTFAISVDEEKNESIYVLEGTVSTSVLGKDQITGRTKPIQRFEIKTGEQLVLNQEKIEVLESGKLTAPEEATEEEADTETEEGEEEEETPEIVFIENISDSFRNTEWFSWNATQDGQRYAYESEEDEEGDDDDAEDDDEEEDAEDEEEEEEVIEEEADAENALVISSPAEKENTNETNITIKGSYYPSRVYRITANGKEANLSSGSFSVAPALSSEGSNEIELIAYDAEDGKVTTKTMTIIRDTVPPSPPEITSPTEGATIEDSAGFTLEGKVSPDTQEVIVTDSAQSYAYTLSAYLPGEVTWQYNARPDFGNLKEGENTYTVVAVDRAGNESNPAEVIVTYAPEEDETETEEATTEDTEETETEEATTEDTEETDTEEETVEDETEEDEGNEEDADESGDDEGNEEDADESGDDDEEEDADNEDEEDTEDNEETENEEDSSVTNLPAPIITIPAAGGSYSTPLNEIAIGGTVNQDAATIYVNGVAISYTAGNTRWNLMVDLEEGENTFTVVAEADNGVQSDPTAITITKE